MDKFKFTFQALAIIAVGVMCGLGIQWSFNLVGLSILVGCIVSTVVFAFAGSAEEHANTIAEIQVMVRNRETSRTVFDSESNATSQADNDLDGPLI